MKPVLEVLTSGTAYLAKRDVDEARLNMEHLLAHVLACRRMDLYLRFDQPVPESALEILRPLLKRRGEGEPLQHLLGTVEFCGHELIVDQRALIPRPETETLVELLLQRTGSQPPLRVLDICTGSGCIGLSLAKAWPQSIVTLSDISEDALELARLNADRLELSSRVKFIRSDLFNKIPGTFDLIVSNPPYIATAEITTLSREVRRDPMLALDGGPTGTEFPIRLAEAAVPHLHESSTLAFELGMDQSDVVAAKLMALGFGKIEVKSDLAGIERFIFASACPQAIIAPGLAEMDDTLSQNADV
ncbi:MAG: peptide chain release factor N(5)-glutamine methyltransferase [Verrucomicrobiaceae bacterium]|nr:peptide chain release factor N(5)-glutamine methyltransferase [Verrucomicrobiaceae bacterium]